jgi:hypothetical protein
MLQSAFIKAAILSIITIGGLFQSHTAVIPTSGLELWLRADTGLTIANNRISQWADQSGKGNNAAHMANTMTVPVKVDNVANNKPALRFDGSNASFRFNRITNVRTVFYVVSKNPSAFNSNNIRFVLGDSSTGNFHPGTHMTDVLACHYTSPDVLNGQVRLNGATVDPEVTNYPTQLGIVTMVTAGACTTSQIAADRWFTDRCWWGDIAEIILYSVSLADNDRAAVEAYLITKYGISNSSTRINQSGLYDDKKAYQSSWRVLSEIDTKHFADINAFNLTGQRINASMISGIRIVPMIRVGWSFEKSQ